MPFNEGSIVIAKSLPISPVDGGGQLIGKHTFSVYSFNYCCMYDHYLVQSHMLANFAEIDAFEEERKKEHVQQSKEAYDQWKAQKDFEMRLQKQSEALDRQRQRGRPLSS